MLEVSDVGWLLTSAPDLGAAPAGSGAHTQGEKGAQPSPSPSTCDVYDNVLYTEKGHSKCTENGIAILEVGTTCNETHA